MQELIGTARRIDNFPLAARHAALLIHLLLMQQQQSAAPALTVADQCDMAKQLEMLTLRCRPALHPGPLALDNGTIIPPVPWTMLPRVRAVKLRTADAALKAHKIKAPSSAENSGPFLFTPIQFGGSFRSKASKKNQVVMGIPIQFNEMLTMISRVLFC